MVNAASNLSEDYNSILSRHLLQSKNAALLFASVYKLVINFGS